MSRITDTIKKLIAHEESARSIGNQLEAEAFAQKISELMLKHKLEMSDIEYEEQERNEPIIDQMVTPADMGLSASPVASAWARTLIYHVAQAHFCTMIRITWRKGRNTYTQLKGNFYLIGRESDRQVVLSLSKFLIHIALEQSDSATRKYGQSDRFYTTGQNDKMLSKYRTSWLTGFVHAIYERFEKTADVVEGNASEHGLVLVKKHEEALTAFVKEKFKHVRKGRAVRRTVHMDGFAAGKEFGSNVTMSDRKKLSA